MTVLVKVEMEDSLLLATAPILVPPLEDNAVVVDAVLEAVSYAALMISCCWLFFRWNNLPTIGSDSGSL